MIAAPTRAQLQQAFPAAGPSVIQFLEALARTVSSNDTAITTGVADTQALQDATVLTLSGNEALNNERIVAAGQGVRLTDTGTQLVIALAFNLSVNGGHRLSLNLSNDADLSVIQSGTVMVEEAPMADLGDYANDAAASTAGVPVSGLYRTGGDVRVRVS